MFPYFIILGISVLFAFFIQNTRMKFTYNAYYFLLFSLLVLFAGLRNYTVGTDTNSYVNAFNGSRNFLDYYFDDNPSSFEIGYLLIQTISKLFSDQYFSLLLTVSFFITLFHIASIKKLSVLPAISIFVFITFGIYTFSFNGMRQAIAAAIFVYSTQFIIEHNLKKYALWIFIGFLFHKTIIIALPLYFLLTKRFTLKLLLILLLASIISSVFFNQIVDFGVIISEKYKAYLESEQVGGKLLTLFYTLLSLFFIIIRYSIKPEFIKKYDVYLNMFIIATMIYLIVYLSGAYIELTRLGFYFLSSAIFIWPIIFKSISKQNKPFLYLFFISIHLLFFYVFLSKMSGLIPYRLNTELFSNL